MIIVNKTSLNFGIISYFDSKQENFSILNDGSTNINITILLNDNNFKCDHSSFSLFPGEKQIITVTFKPEIIQVFQGSLEIQNDINNLSIELKGESVSAGIYLNKEEIDFGEVTVRSSKIENLLVSNISEEDVNLVLTSITTSSQEFKQSVNSFVLNKGVALQIPVVFSPSTSTSKTSTLEIQCNDNIWPIKTVNLSGTGISAPNISFSEEQLNFDDTEINKFSIKSFKIFNYGDRDLSITKISSNNESFSITPSNGGIVPGESLEIFVKFLPVEKKQIISNLDIYSNDPDLPIKRLNINGTGISPSINLSPEIIDFLNVSVNEVSCKKLAITNNSTCELIIEKIESSSSIFYVSETFPLVISSYKEINVYFKPENLGEVNANLKIYSNDIDKQTSSITIKGIGVFPNMIVSPNLLNFNNVCVGETLSLEISISNTGSGNLIVSEIISTDNNFYTDQTSLQILPEQTKNIIVFFAPNIEANKTAEIKFINNDPDSPDISIPVQGFGSFPKFKVAQTNIDFSSYIVNESKTIEYFIQNLGLVDLKCLVSSSSSEFVVSKNDVVVTAGSSNSFFIAFTPTEVNDFNGVLKITTNDPDNSEILINISGKGINSPKISVDPKSLLFNDVQVGKFKNLPITINNSGTEILKFSTTIDNSKFSVDYTSGEIDPEGSKNLVVSFKPTSLDSLSGILKISSNDFTEPDIEVALKGTVISSILAWDKINTEKWIPKEILTVSASLTQIIDPIVSALDIVSSVLSIVKAFVIDITDPMKILLEQLKKTIDDFINDLGATGLYVLYVMPGQLGVNPKTYPQYFKKLPKSQYNIFDLSSPSWFDCVKGGYSSFLAKVTQSFDDPGDGNRPQFSENSSVGGYVMMFDSGTIGPDDLAKFIKSIQKLMKLFKSPFKVAFEPPSNVSCFAGNGVVRVTFTPSSSVLPKEYFIFRSKTQGGEPVYFSKNGSDYEYHDENGKAIRSYELIGVTNVVEQFAEIAGMKDEEAKTKLEQFGYSAKQVASSVFNGDPFRFVFEDKSVSNDQTYYYVVVAGYTTLTGTKDYSSMPKDIKTSDFEEKIVSTINQETKKAVEKRVAPRSVTSTKILCIGSLSAEVSAMPTNAVFETKGGLARCRYFRCGFEEQIEEKFVYTNKDLNFISISHTPIAGSVKIKVNRGNDQFTAVQSSYRVDYTPKNKENKDGTPSNIKSFEASSGIFIKSNFYFKENDILDISYKFKKDLKKEEILYEPVTLDKNKTFITSKHPIDTNEIVVFENGFKNKINPSEVIVLNDKDGRVKVLRHASTKLLVSYTYYSDFDNSKFFKCVKSEYQRYFFDIAKCDGGSTLCTGYDNANCFYNNGTGCTNTEKSQRKTFVKNNGFEPENIDFNLFWDPIACQNGIMQQRCDGYSKCYPRYSPKVWPDWSSVKLSAIGMFPLIEDIMKVMQNMMDALLAGTEKMSNSVVNFIDLLQKKIDSLKALLEKIKEFLVTLTEDFALPDLYFLRIPYATGGNKYLKECISKSTNGPTDEPTAYTAGIVFVYGDPGLGNALKLFFG